MNTPNIYTTLQRALPTVSLSLLVAWLSACSTTPSSRYSMSQDAGPQKAVDLSHVKEPVPKKEPLSRGGNKPYRVLGKQYYPLSSTEGFVEEGVASWYGRKFHGHRTSNGEVYDMYQMSAAHKTLPLPSFVKVTNTDTGRSVVVRVNDRGPFHGNRIIDLSYAAAAKLGYANKGTARVRVEAIDLSQSPEAGRFLQLEAFMSKVNAERFIAKAKSVLGQLPIFIQYHESNQGPVHRVRVGPLDPKTLDRALVDLNRAQFKQPLILPNNDV